MSASQSVAIGDITPDQSRAGRGLLDWSRDRLAANSGIPKRTIMRFEGREAAPRASTLAAIRASLEAAGVLFIAPNGGGPGVRLRSVDCATATPPSFASTMAAALDSLSTKAAEDAKTNEGGAEPAAGSDDETPGNAGRA